MPTILGDIPQDWPPQPCYRRPGPRRRTAATPHVSGRHEQRRLAAIRPAWTSTDLGGAMWVQPLVHDGLVIVATDDWVDALLLQRKKIGEAPEYSQVDGRA